MLEETCCRLLTPVHIFRYSEKITCEKWTAREQITAVQGRKKENTCISYIYYIFCLSLRQRCASLDVSHQESVRGGVQCITLTP